MPTSRLMQENLPNVPHRRRIAARRSRNVGEIVKSWTREGVMLESTTLNAWKCSRLNPNGKCEAILLGMSEPTPKRRLSAHPAVVSQHAACYH